MSDKEMVMDLVGRLPAEASVDVIVREIEFVAGVRQGIAELDRGEGVPMDEVERELPTWIIR